MFRQIVVASIGKVMFDPVRAIVHGKLYFPAKILHRFDVLGVINRAI